MPDRACGASNQGTELDEGRGAEIEGPVVLIETWLSIETQTSRPSRECTASGASAPVEVREVA